jgi:hypothetical protein
MELALKNEKAVIRSILLAMGRQATVQDFLLEYKKIEGQDLNNVLIGMNLKFGEFMMSISDVCHCWKSNEGVMMIGRVSTEDSSHMDHLTIEGSR